MYEGHFNRAGFPETRDSADLRRFQWTDLVARIAATRDLRDEFARIEAGFGAFGEVRREGNEKGKQPGNHDASGHGKGTGLSLDPAANDAVHGDREKE
ncbi:MAG: hypothetical protein R3E14_07315 [Erythrobacter sp.]